MLVLSGDIGGTSTRVQLSEIENNNRLKHINTEVFPSENFQSFSEVIHRFLTDSQFDVNQINAACFGVAGPVVNGQVRFTNLPWVLSEQSLSDELNVPYVKFINDFEAIGYGVPYLRAQDYHTLQTGKPQDDQIIALVGAGTGLGIALLSQNQGEYQVFPTEGGHVDFAPTNEDEDRLLLFLRKRINGRVSIERLLSGRGIVNIFEFVTQILEPKSGENDRLVKKVSTTEHPAALISGQALNHRHPLAVRTLEMFTQIYGSAVGNLALTTLPYGGLYVVGGIAPKIMPFLTSDLFMKAFYNKGRVARILEGIPVHIVQDTKIGLNGASYLAATLK